MQLQVVSSVVTPASSYALVSLDVVRDELQFEATDVSDNKWLIRAINQVSAAVVSYCNNKIVSEELQDIFFPDLDPFPFQVPGGIDRLQLSRWPVTKISAVTTTDANGNVTTLAAETMFDGELASGQLVQINPITGYPMLWSPLQTTVTYTAGYTTVPPDIEEVVLRMITARYRGRDRDPYLKAEEGAQGKRREWWVPSAPEMRGSLPLDVAAALDPYRVPVVA